MSGSGRRASVWQSGPMEPWTLIETRNGSAGYLPIVNERFRMPDGTEAVWDVFGAPATVAIVAVTEHDEVVLARQYRPGPKQVLDELPGGYIDPGESVLAAAQRELLEETGYVGELELAGSSWLAASARTRRHVVVARNAEKVADSSPEPGEIIDVELVHIREFRQHLQRGDLTDVDLGYLALDFLGLLDEPAQ